jgi:large subunit ribosomal protein L29
MKASDLREKNAEDLHELQKALARDVFQNRLKNFTNRLDDTSSMRKTKRDLARVATLLRERALNIVRAGAPAAKAEGAVEAKAAKVPAAKATKAPKAEAKSAEPKKASAKKAAAKATKKGEAK